MDSVLKNIIDQKKKEVACAKKKLPLKTLLLKIKADKYQKRNFKASICKPHKINIIGELKKASPSKGRLRKQLNLVRAARIYAKAGICAISVLTDINFCGRLSDIKKVKDAVNIPVLRKDFIIDTYQLYESRYAQADAVLLIASILTKKKLTQMLRIAKTLGIEALVEVHKQRDLAKIALTSVNIIGINNRNLDNFKVDIKTTERLLPKLPRKKIIVSESGINSYQDIIYLKNLGVNACLIGESIVSSPEMDVKIQQLRGKKREPVKVKICGITNTPDAQNAVKAGADAVGFVFAKSPRRITPNKARGITLQLPPAVFKIGVFVNEKKSKVLKIAKACKLDALQFHGQETNAYCAYFRKQYKVIKTIRIKDKASLTQIHKYKDIDAYLLDTFDNRVYGGTGKCFNLNLAKSLNLKKPIIAAGGINVKNVRTIIRSIKPCAVDVSTSVEKAKGKKDFKRMRTFVKRAKQVTL